MPEMPQHQGHQQRTTGRAQTETAAQINAADSDTQCHPCRQGENISTVDDRTAVATVLAERSDILRLAHDGEHIVAEDFRIAMRHKGIAQTGNAGNDDTVVPQCIEFTQGFIAEGGFQHDNLGHFTHQAVIRRHIGLNAAQQGHIAVHLAQCTHHKNPHTVSKGIICRQRDQNIIFQNAGHAALQQAFLHTAENAPPLQPRIFNAHHPGHNALRVLVGRIRRIQTLLQQPGKQLHKQHHPHHPERIRHAITDIDGTGRQPQRRHGFKSSCQARSAGAGTGKQPGGHPGGKPQHPAQQQREPPGAPHHQHRKQQQTAPLALQRPEKAVAHPEPHAVHEQRRANAGNPLRHLQPEMPRRQGRKQHTRTAQRNSPHRNLPQKQPHSQNTK